MGLRTQRQRVRHLEDRQAAKTARPGKLHVHYAEGRNPCPACDASGPPRDADTVLEVVYADRAEAGGK